LDPPSLIVLRIVQPASSTTVPIGYGSVNRLNCLGFALDLRGLRFFAMSFSGWRLHWHGVLGKARYCISVLTHFLKYPVNLLRRANVPASVYDAVDI
jgi:hypothetical protein